MKHLGSAVASLPELLLEPCRPPWWAASGHLQTILAYLIRSPVLDAAGEPFVFKLDDGDQLLSSITRGSSGVVVSLFHGLSGDIEGNYMHRTARLAQALGHTCVRINHRGAGLGHGLAMAPYHSGRREDVAKVISTLRQKFPGKKQIAVGFSMSGNILLYLLGSSSGQAGQVGAPDVAITVNGAIDLQDASVRLGRGFNRIYDLNFVHELRRSILEKQAIGAAPADIRIPRFSRVYDLDKLYTARVCHFKSREDYYSICSAYAGLKNITVPTYVLTAADDPFINVELYRRAEWSRQVRLTISEHGGHLGYLTRSKIPRGSHRWLDYYLEQAFIAADVYLAKLDSTKKQSTEK